MDIPINAEVFCADGSYGRSTRVILNPATQQVTHLVVKEAVWGIERMVPLDLVQESTPSMIRLNISKSDLEKLPPVTITEYLQPMLPFNQYDVNQYIMWPYAVTNIPLEHDMIPPDELAVRRGTWVEATDGHVGRVSEFIVSPTNGHISHLVLEEGPFWSKKDVTIPIAQVDRIEKDTVYLKLDRQAIAALPTIPVHRGMQSHR
jgi:PRC-barrel domain